MFIFGGCLNPFSYRETIQTEDDSSQLPHSCGVLIPSHTGKPFKLYVDASSTYEGFVLIPSHTGKPFKRR